MTRLIPKAIDIGASFVFAALCGRAFLAHFYNDLQRASGGATSAEIIEFKRPQAARARSTSHRSRLPSSY
jgi:hypothetical protein